MSSSKKKVLLNTVSVNLGCSCKRPKLSSIFSPRPKKSKIPIKYQKHHNNYSYYNNSSSSTSTSTSSANWGGKTGNSYSSSVDTTTSSTVSPYTSSVAVEKDSSDPFSDFKQSMLQMIMENEIYSKDDLKHLLNCFLQLNSPSLHGVIIRAFTEIWNAYFFSQNHSFTSPRFFVPTLSL